MNSTPDMASERTLPWHHTWSDVDKTSDPDWFVRYLNSSRSEGLKIAERNPHEFFSYLDLHEGHRVLEVGCGTATSLIPLASVIGSTGRVVGVDRSKAMIAEARKQLADTSLPIECLVADVYKLGFESNSFDRSFSNAVFQHLDDPKKALEELKRVTRMGGRIVVSENDWDSQIIASSHISINRRILSFFSDSIRNGRIGSQLVGLFKEQGLSNLGVVPLTSVSTDFAKTEQNIGLSLMAERAMAAGAISLEEGELWMRDLEERAHNGAFFRAVTLLRVHGHKPYPVYV
jgi:ubiquinone/menaquinone biosynthesis C-methylase UbiE